MIQNKHEKAQDVALNSDCLDDLSSKQKQVYSEHGRDNDHLAGNMGLAWWVIGELDETRFRKALVTVCDRHESCLSTYPLVGGKPLRKRNKPLGEDLLSEEHISALSREALPSHIESVIRSPFVLSDEVPIRWFSFKREDRIVALCVQAHAIAFDLESLAVFVAELGQVYAGESSYYLSENKIGILAARRGVLAENATMLQEFWNNKLQGVLPMLNVQSDLQRPPVLGYQASVYRWMVPSSLAKKLQEAAGEEEGVGKYLFLSALQVFLHRYTGQDDVLVATSTSGRGPESASLIAPLADLVPCRSLFKRPAQSFEAFYEVNASEIQAALKHGTYPFAQILADLGEPVTSENCMPICQVRFEWVSRPRELVTGKEGVERWHPGGMNWERIPLSPEYDRFDLSLRVIDTGESLILEFGYNTNLYEQFTIKRLAANFHTLLASLAKNTNTPLDQLDLLTLQERDDLVIACNDTKRAYPKDRCFHHEFEDRAKESPSKVALVVGDQEFCYRELNERANQLAHTLIERGIGNEDFVGVCMHRSLNMMVGLLAILKAGAAYLPLDPAFPEDRLKYMVEDSGLFVLLTEFNLAAPLKNKVVTVLHLDEDWINIAEQSNQNPAIPTNPANRAYVIYTSGSTGKPKGVQVSHQAFLNFVLSMATEPGICADDIMLAVTTLSFDICGLEIWGPLIVGATVVLAAKEVTVNGPLLLELMRTSRATIMQATPVSWRLMLGAGWQPGKPLKMLCGGEPLPAELVELLVVRGELWNMYGPTETTVWSTTGRVLNGSLPISIGRPINNTDSYLIDSHFQLAPQGGIGELVIGGDGLARGYHNRAGQTAVQFVPNPHSGFSGDRMYKTGDLARWLPDSNLECLGRIDHQVKVRGYRIELGEIESVIINHENVKQVVVIVREDEPGNQRLVAYTSTVQGTRLDSSAIRERVRASLPEYMVPSAVVVLPEFPLTPNGKVDRRNLPAPTEMHSAVSTTAVPRSQAERIIAEIWQDALRAPAVGVNDNFFELGGHSLLVEQVRTKMFDYFDREVLATDLFQYPTIRSLAHFLTGGEADDIPVMPHRNRSVSGSGEVAVIGMSARFPEAPDVDTFWQNIRDGVVSIKHFSEDELLEAGSDPIEIKHPDYVPFRGFLENIEYFDARFFNYTPKEAEVLDPQQRFFLEGAWQALENACCNPHTYPGRIGVFGSLNFSTYLFFHLFDKRDFFKTVGNFQVGVANMPDTMPTRVSFKLNLTGPSYAVQTACSSSLVGIHLACKSLLNGECELALAGGVSIHAKQQRGYLWEEGGIQSSSGQVRAFDAKADGTIFGGGQGIVVLKRLEDAVAERDRILAVVKGSALNNDGSQKVAFTAVSVKGQSEVIAAAQAVAGVAPESISYIETHGTGTKMGDPIEVAALTRAFRAGTHKKGFCALGSVKPNIGHLDAAAGVAGFVKAVLALQHKQIPPSCNYEEPNPAIKFADSPFFVNSTLSVWKKDTDLPRRCGVSSLGVGGTNAHAILEEAPEQVTSGHSRRWQLLPLSTKSKTALDKATTNLQVHLEAHPDLKLADVAFSLQVGRAAFDRRRFILADSMVSALAALAAEHPGKTGSGTPKPRSIVFMFSGQGSQYLNMARGLYEDEPFFQHQVDTCAELLLPYLGEDLRDMLYPDLAPDDDAGRAAASKRINQTDITQPALFAVEYAMAKLWMSWGLLPAAMIGHSIGEYVAACLAGVFSLEDALKIVASRGRLMQDQPSGDMMAVPLSEAELKPLLSDAVDMAALNELTRCVVSGPKHQIDALEVSLKEKDVAASRLITSHAFHSSMMDGILEPFTELVREVVLKAPTIPYISNVTGTWITEEQATDPSYYAKHLRGAVRFAEGIALLLEEPDHFFIEAGPGRTLVSFTKRQLKRESPQQAFSTIRHPKQQDNDMTFLLDTLGQLWLGGVEIDWPAFTAGEKRSRLALPSYPFERQRYWIEPGDDQGAQHTKGRKKEITDWFYTPAWRQAPLPHGEAMAIREGACWLIFDEQCGLGAALSSQLKEAGHRVITVTPASSYKRITDHSYQLNPADREDYLQLMTDLLSLHLRPDNITHLWNVTASLPVPDDLDYVQVAQDRSFYSPLFLAQALSEAELTEPMRIRFVSNRMHAIESSDTIDPIKATLLGPCKVLPTECTHITCQSIDLVLPTTKITADHPLVSQLKRELETDPDHVEIALRGRQRWKHVFASERLTSERAEAKPLLKEGGTYFITGGLGGIGLAVAEYLAETKKANLVLLGRSAFPEKDQWDNYLATKPADDRTTDKIRILNEMEAVGAKIQVVQADVTNPAQLAAACQVARKEFGTVDGVFHCAGVPGSGLMQLKDRSTAARVLDAKIRGTLLLRDQFREHKLDFFAMCSSIYTVAGHVGQVDYCAANAYLDAFAHHHALTGELNVVSINWDAWREAGMAVETETSAQLRQKREQELLLAMTNREGSEAFCRIVSDPSLTQVVVTPLPLETRPLNIHELIGESDDEDASEPQTSYSRPELESSYEAPTTETQRLIAEVVQEKLGYDQIGIQDNFYDLGLDSLIATTVAGRLQKAFKIKIPPGVLLDETTIEAVASHVDSILQIAQPQERETAETDESREEFLI